MLIALMAASPTWVYAQPLPAEDGTKVDLSYITPQAFVAAVAYPRRVLTAPEMEMLPVEVISAAGKKELGVDPLDVEQVIAVVEPPAAGPPDFGIVVRLAKPYRLDSLILPPDMPLADAQLEGRPYRQPQVPMVPGFYMPDDKTLIIATDAMLKKMLTNRKNPVAGPLSQLMAKTGISSDAMVVTVLEPIRPMLSAQLDAVPVPPPFEGAKRLPSLIDAAKLDLSVVGSARFSLALLSSSDANAKTLEDTINQLMDAGQQMAVSQMAAQMTGDDPVEQAGMQYAQRITTRMFEMFRPQRTANRVKIAHEGEAGAQMATIGILVALLLPAVQAAREAARRMSASNNLKQIALAMHNYHDVYKRFPPPASLDANGKPLLSWRVHILPFVEEMALYEQFKLDEPWDSPHNSQLIDKMPQVYQNPSGQPSANKADYVVPTGKGSIFENPEGTPIRSIRDGTSNTIMVLEVNDEASVIWTKPDDLQFDVNNPLAGLGKAHPGGFNVALADGSVRFISITIDPQLFLRLLQMADGQAVGEY
jgi:prepilin-type processing-associated H-X9-DG protein